MTPFALVCFCVLMDHHKSGVEDASPDYLVEKFSIMSNASDDVCFSMLDLRDQERVRQWVNFTAAELRARIQKQAFSRFPEHERNELRDEQAEQDAREAMKPNKSQNEKQS